MAAKEYMKVERRPPGCWGRSPNLGRVPNGPNLIHGPLDQTKMTQHLCIDKLLVIIQSLRPPQIDMDLIPDPYENRLHKDSMKYLNAPI